MSKLQTNLNAIDQKQAIPGPKGEKGIQGNQGNQGNRGSKGDQGSTGRTGSRGSTGPRGQKGNKGERGYRGANPPEYLEMTRTGFDGKRCGPYIVGTNWNCIET